jgi:hypothetical protein
MATLRYWLHDHSNSTLRETMTELLSGQTTWLDIYPDAGTTLSISVSDIHHWVDMCSFRLWRPSDDMGVSQDISVWTGLIHRHNTARAIDGALGWPEPTVIEARFLPPGEYRLTVNANVRLPNGRAIEDSLTESIPIRIDEWERVEAHISLPEFIGHNKLLGLTDTNEVHLNPEESVSVETRQ